MSAKGSEARPGLIDALRIQLAGSARVGDGGRLAGQALADRVENAVKIVRKKRAVLALWVQGPVPLSDRSEELVLYLVGEHRGRALVEVLQIPCGAGPEVDRTLALKTREVLDDILSGVPSESLLEEPESAMPVKAASPLGWFVDLGLAIGSQKRSNLGQWGLSLGAGGHLRIADSISLGARLSFRLFPSVDIETEQGRVTFHELDPGLYLIGLLHPLPFLAVGLQQGALLGFVDAEGTTPSGASGSSVELVPSLLSELMVELELRTGLVLRLGAGLEVNLRKLRFAVNDEEVANLGRIRPQGQAALVLFF